MAQPKSNDQLKALLEQVEEGVKAVFESEKYRKYLSTMAKFHSYSFRNSLLILLQRPSATRVAGYAAWKSKFKRYVRQGEQGIQIIGFTPRNVTTEREKKDASGNTVLDASGKPVMEKVTKQVPGFSPVYVFDVSQTEGEPLPQLVTELDGSVNDYKNLLYSIYCTSSFPIYFEDVPGGAKGFCDPSASRIVIQHGMSEAQTIKTAIHEMTHADLHAPEYLLAVSNRTDRRTREVEAESTAFVVCEHYGIDTSDYTFPYLASWSSSRELTELASSLETIQKKAAELIDKIDSRLLELQNNKDLNLLRYEAAKTFVSLLEMVDPTFGPAHSVPGQESRKQWAMAIYEKMEHNSNFIEGELKQLETTYPNSFNNEPVLALAAHIRHLEDQRRYHETLDSVKFDGDIDLDQEKTRAQLGFKDADPKKPSMKERMAAAQAEADQRSSSRAPDQPIQNKTTERGE